MMETKNVNISETVVKEEIVRADTNPYEIYIKQEVCDEEPVFNDEVECGKNCEKRIDLEWSNEKTIYFIELYERHPILWNSMEPEHKNRTKVNDAWISLRSLFDKSISISILKRKKESLMSTYRPLRRKVVESEGTGDVFKPSWYAYEAIDRFMRVKGIKRSSINFEDGREPEVTKYKETDDSEIHEISDGDVHNIDPRSSENNATEALSKPTRSQSAANEKRRRGKQLSQRDVCVPASSKDATWAIKNISTRPTQRDESHIFGQLVAQQLRQLTPRSRILTQAEISSVLTQALLKDLDNGSSISIPSSSPSSTPSFREETEITVPNQSPVDINSVLSLTLRTDHNNYYSELNEND